MCPRDTSSGSSDPNGSGKSTLLNIARAFSRRRRARSVLGEIHRRRTPTQLGRVGFVAQDTPVYSGLAIDDHLRYGKHINPTWDDELARRRIEQLGLDSINERASSRAVSALSSRSRSPSPSVPISLLLDEPVASLDPLARREFLQILMETVADHNVSVLLSSHLVADIERVCDYLVILVSSQGPTRRRRRRSPRDRTTDSSDRATCHLPRAKSSSSRATPTVKARSSCAPTDRSLDPRLDRRGRQPRGPRASPTWVRAAATTSRRPTRSPHDLARLAPVPRASTDRGTLLFLLFGSAFSSPDLDSCTPTTLRSWDAGPRRLQRLTSSFLSTDPFFQNLLTESELLAVLIGIFWGAPVVAREFDTGTYRLAWTQSVTRTRWLASKLFVGGLASVVTAGLFTLMATWWSSPLDRVRDMPFSLFDTRDIAPLAMPSSHSPSASPSAYW